MFHYTLSGLDYVWLQNGYKVRETKYGESVAIEDVEGLHRMIAKDIVSNRVSLTGPEFRFLRKELKMSQASIAGVFGNDTQTISLWERGEGEVPKWAHRMLRALYIEVTTGAAGIQQMVERVNELERTILEASHQFTTEKRMELVDTDHGWELAA